MYGIDARRRALELAAEGNSLNTVSHRTGISRWTIRKWQRQPDPFLLHGEVPCPRCRPEASRPDDHAAYAYLLGLYLGDGCISPHPRRGGYYLRIACADARPGLVTICREAVAATLPGREVRCVRKQGCVMVTSYSKHWPCLLPQHGPGKKHDRRIVLKFWQQEIVDEYPWEFARGLVHSDGCRITNWATRTVAGERKRYEYPRYFFTNKSDDIRQLYTDTLDRLGVVWTHCTRDGKPYNISVARRASVALMDRYVGPKH
ncbi:MULTISPECIES: transcriptional regulator [Streptomyces]|uniref:Transcriptional regulator n=1 Tax=Streptomyces lycii TaxID=2654337 RepID=A0ABQ7FEQ1_9ACTN|nr:MULTISPECIES: transcriptional regulator [Streptomyces]KAF4407280.1 transcriptional regulator [Streptomyces lycii]PGH50892.1 transcriptional regulator [Streptomyces sp. Ru87]